MRIFINSIKYFTLTDHIILKVVLNYINLIVDSFSLHGKTLCVCNIKTRYAELTQ